MNGRDPRHAGEQLRALRRRAGMSIDEVASRADVSAEWLAELEAGVGTHDVLYSEWVKLVRATQPPRPDWWDEGYEHDLSLPPDGHRAPTTETGRRYWGRIEQVRVEIHEHYRRGEPDSP